MTYTINTYEEMWSHLATCALCDNDPEIVSLVKSNLPARIFLAEVNALIKKVHDEATADNSA